MTLDASNSGEPAGSHRGIVRYLNCAIITVATTAFSISMASCKQLPVSEVPRHPWQTLESMELPRSATPLPLSILPSGTLISITKDGVYYNEELVARLVEGHVDPKAKEGEKATAYLIKRLLDKLRPPGFNNGRYERRARAPRTEDELPCFLSPRIRKLHTGS